MSEIKQLKKQIRELEIEILRLKMDAVAKDNPWPGVKEVLKIHRGYRHKAKPGDPRPMWLRPADCRRVCNGA